MTPPPDAIREINADGPVPTGLRIAIVVSRYNQWITDALVAGAMETAQKRAPDARIDVIGVPGSFEVVAAAGAAAQSAAYDAIVALGCIIKGETSHDHHLASAVTTELARISAGGPGTRVIPVGLGVLTVDSADQAEARAGGVHGNKGAEAMGAALDMVTVLRQMPGLTFPSLTRLFGSL